MTTLRGDLVLQELTEALALHALEEVDQDVFLDIMKMSSWECIFKDEFAPNKERILAAFGQGEPNWFPLSLITADRRAGKSWTAEWFVACCLVCLEGVSIAIVRPSRRQCDFTRDNVLSNVAFLAKNGFRCNVPRGMNNKSLLGVQRGENLNKFYPLTPDSAPKCETHLNMVICDDMAKLPRDFLNDWVWPLLSTPGTAVIGISALQGCDEFVRKMIEDRNHDGMHAHEYRCTT